MRKLLVILALVLLPLAPARAQFCPGVAPWVFVDVAASHAFCTYVTWMAQHNVTLGCLIIDANNREYCPDDYVTRLQMAAFMSRLGDALFPSTCAAGQVMKWNGLAWTCADDSLGGGGGGGTVTSVAASTGLAAVPNPITGAGTLSVAPSYRLPQSCAANQVAKWIGGMWTCANDVDTNAGGTVMSLTQGSGILLAPNPIVATGMISADPAYLQRRVSVGCAVGSSIRAIALDGSVTCETDDAGPANAFVQGGNAFGATAVLGTTDNFALDVRVNSARVMRYEPNTVSPNLVGGFSGNSVTAGVRGATIGGGGAAAGSDPNLNDEAPNRVTDHYGTVGGGFANTAGDNAGTTSDRPFATVGGGRANSATDSHSTVGGGHSNSAAGQYSAVGGGNGNSAASYASTVGGGDNNSAAGLSSTVGGGNGNSAAGNGSTVGGGNDNAAAGTASTVIGGSDNEAAGDYSAVGGGWNNSAAGFSSTVGGGANNSTEGNRSTVGGGNDNSAAGTGSTVIGGSDNDAAGDYSVAMGRRAKALGNGSFSFADSNNFDFSSNTPNAFRVRATGGVRFVTDIDGTGAVTWSCLAVAGAGWACASDRNLKHSLVELDARAVLDKVAALPVYQWQPKGQNAHVLHYGPMAQDFHAAFGLGDDDKMIGMQDADGVALAAIKGLNEKVEEQAREIAQLRALVERLVAVR